MRRARMPGGSHLYAGGERWRGRAPSGEPVSDEKLAQLERSSDVAEKRGSIVGEIASVDAKT